MRCSACGTENPATANFCEECGARLARACPHCGREVSPTAKFCAECGQGLATAPTSAEHQASPHAYTPRHPAETIPATRSGLEGERKQVTVLFADIAGSTELIQGLDPEEAQTLLDGALKLMMDAVHRYGGTVGRLMGDGLMALFGAPTTREDHAVRACYAALAMQEAIRPYAEETRRRRGIEVRARIGLNSGEVVVRVIADDLHMDYTALGQAVHLAARMEQVAAPGSIRLTRETLCLAEGHVQVRPLGPVAIKGLSEPLEVFELLGPGTARTRLQARAAGGLTRFVGREADLEVLRGALGRAARGRGQVVVLVGEPGVGKSRLVWEVTHSARSSNWRILETGAVSYEMATPYLPVVDLLRSYFRIEARADPGAARRSVADRLLTLDAALEPALPALLGLLDLGADDPSWRALDPPQRRRLTLDAVKRLLLRESREQPLLLVFEDLQWVDGETQALLDTLVEGLPTACVLLLVNYRPEYRHGWGNKTYYTQLQLDPLPPEGAEDLLRSLLGAEPALGALQRHLIERTEGNPFFLEESVRELVETGALVGERGAYRPATDSPRIRLPATVQAVLAARVDRLSTEDKRLLQSAAVIGKDVPLALLRAIAERSEGEVDDALARLQAAEFLYEAGLFPEVEYTFKHALTHEVAYGGLLQERRRTLHARIVEAIERLYPDRLAEHVERLAHHSVRAEAWDRALVYLRQAGQKAAARSANREAVVAFDQALEVLGRLPTSHATLEQAVDLRIDLRNPLWSLGQFGRVFELLSEAESLAETLGDRRRQGWVCCYMGNSYWLRGEHDRALEPEQRALAIAGQAGDVALEVMAHFYLGLIYHNLGDCRRATDAFAHGVELLREHAIDDWLFRSVIARSWLGRCLADRGAFADGIAHVEEAVRMAEAANHTLGIAYASNTLGLVLLHRGDLHRALPILEQNFELCRSWSFQLQLPTAVTMLGYGRALSGDVRAALALLESAAPQTARARVNALLLARLSEGYLLADRLDTARVHGERALSFALDRRERGNAAWAHWVLGEIAARREPPGFEQAEHHYSQALALAGELGMRPLQAHCHLSRGTLYRKLGRPEDARAELSMAVEMLRAMEMIYWIPQAEAELAEATASSSVKQGG